MSVPVAICWSVARPTEPIQIHTDQQYSCSSDHLKAKVALLLNPKTPACFPITTHISFTLLLQATATSAAANPEATSRVLAESFIASANKGDDVKKSFASATAEAFKVAQHQGSSNLDSLSSAMAAASAQAAATNVNAAAQALAATAAQAASAGVTDSFARSQAMAFSASRRQNNLGSFARAVASAIRDGGAPASQAYSAAFAKAIAAGGNQAAGLAGEALSFEPI